MCKFCVDGVGEQDFDIFSGRPIGGFNKSFCPPNRGLGAKPMKIFHNCDICKKKIETIRWHCSKCADFDMCSNCYDNKREMHSEEHPFQQHLEEL